jgi:hypothetical protein
MFSVEEQVKQKTRMKQAARRALGLFFNLEDGGDMFL